MQMLTQYTKIWFSVVMQYQTNVEILRLKNNIFYKWWNAEPSTTCDWILRIVSHSKIYLSFRNLTILIEIGM